MKKFAFLMLAVCILAGTLFTGSAAAWANEPVQQVKKSSPVEVYYFHLTRRCMTCQTVEKVAEEAVKQFFPEAVKSGDVTFKALNFEDNDNKQLIKKLKVSGQSLLIVNGKERVDITDKGFMYAVNQPEKLKAEVKANVEKFMK